MDDKERKKISKESSFSRTLFVSNGSKALFVSNGSKIFKMVTRSALKDVISFQITICWSQNLLKNPWVCVFIQNSCWQQKYFQKFLKIHFQLQPGHASRLITLGVWTKGGLCTYRKIARSNTSCLEAHAGFFRLLMDGIFYLYVLTETFWKKLIS